MADPQIKIGHGFDHHLVKNASEEPEECMRAQHPGSGIRLIVKTTQPGFQLYSGNFLADSSHGKFNNHQGFCIETQAYPDAINQPGFSSPILRAEEVYEEKTIFRVESAGLE